MSNQRIMKGRSSYETVSSVLQGLTLSSPQPLEGATGFRFQPGKIQDAGAGMSRQEKSCYTGDQHSEWYEEGNIRSTESFVGLQLHSPPVCRNKVVYEKDGDETESGGNSEEVRYSSLPATITCVEETEDRASFPTYGPPTPDGSESQTSSFYDSKPPTDRSESKTEDSSGSGSLPWIPNVPILESILPTSSSDSNCAASSDQDSQAILAATEEMSSEGVIDMKNYDDVLSVDLREVKHTMMHVKESLQGFLQGSSEDLQGYLADIINNPLDFGFYVTDKLKPSYANDVMVYRLNKEFIKKRIIHQLENDCGVFLCQDRRTKHLFILKKIMKNNQRLVGIEFLAQHSCNFLPKIYGVYKERDTISIFQEYIEGGTLLHTNWNLAKIRVFAEELLSAVHYLHTHDLVHADIKLRNLMVRDLSKPESLVLIDFESAKHPTYPFHKGGHTLVYLPPWHEELTELDRYHQVLKTVDLWAAACVIIFFLVPSERGELGDVWSQVIKDIRKNCGTCGKEGFAGKYCTGCRKAFLHYVKVNGHNILHFHLGHLMRSQIDDPDWKALRKVLEYLTDTTNVHDKHIAYALSIIKGPLYCQAAIMYETDYDINR